MENNNFYKDMIAVTNRHLLDTGSNPADALLAKLEDISKLGVKAIVLREKDLDIKKYKKLAIKAIDICSRSNTPLILHSFGQAAIDIGHRSIHLPLPDLYRIYGNYRSKLSSFDTIGTSVHSVQDMITAMQCGATYVFAGNIYPTDCKSGLPGRGLNFLAQVCSISTIPVYAIGGVTPEKMPELLMAGASGGCMMSGFMKIL